MELKRIVLEKKITSIMVTHDFDEAIFFSDTILVLGGSPATILEARPINLEDPYDRTFRKCTFLS